MESDDGSIFLTCPAKSQVLNFIGLHDAEVFDLLRVLIHSPQSIPTVDSNSGKMYN